MADLRAIIAGNYSDLKFIKTRSVAQVIVEIPIEQADAFLKMFGAPQPGKEIPVALARLVKEPSVKARETAQTHTRDNADPKADRPKRAFADLSLPEQAGIRSQDQSFQMFLMASGYAAADDHDAAEVVRRICNVKSRTELATDNIAAGKWLALNTSFEHWQTDQRYGDMKR